MLFFEEASEDMFALDVVMITYVGLLISPKLGALFFTSSLLVWAFCWKR